MEKFLKEQKEFNNREDVILGKLLHNMLEDNYEQIKALKGDYYAYKEIGNYTISIIPNEAFKKLSEK